MTMSSLNTVIPEDKSVYSLSSQFNQAGKFSNTKPSEPFKLGRLLTLLKRSVFEKKHNSVPNQTIPMASLSRQDIEQWPADKTSIVRLGHSTILIKVSNQLWLLDPVFSERASPFSFIGPKRFHQTPLSISELPDLDGVIISHNHYDHMDKQSIKALHKRVKRFVMPLGNAEQLAAWGVPRNKISELDWWQSLSIEGLELIATPAQHFSGRGLGDRDNALWSSWVIRSNAVSLFFSGDTGYFDGFKQIGKRYGPFDMTMMESGAYDRDWSDVHMSPKESVQAHLDLKGRKMLPIHNGTFDLAFHAWTDPFEQLVDIANQEWVDLMTPKMGQLITLGDEASVDAARDLLWWRE